MPKTTKAQKRAQVNYLQKLKDSGYKRIAFIIRPEWKERVKKLIEELDNYKG